ncbi:protein of unknown function DUF1555 [Desulfonatronospira thiodismutans ASO3-1]|uniref:PEP-CTERM protein-sorting domain-containing protein n=1 Tax=Desulfonatronospira thiodismutans ASO3-1 TaxID=555779 RepID=D6SKR5_9BACT|nr:MULTISPECIES: VPLPA-CTERM sorting domain-containing protein [Desulfonatronospira]EFI35276.1 protein of unknown function DUF1555 [Desulfonatronospira thiodismutans ASO3-1]RQD73696.1 MAG: VPLPA-CTERM sorting domain-containing protein [Desulfonatronospira sp. MSAO_Bac3]
MFLLKKCFVLAALCMLITLGTALPLKAATVYSGAWTPTSNSTEFFNVTFNTTGDSNFNFFLYNNNDAQLMIFERSQLWDAAQVGISRSDGTYSASLNGTSLVLGANPHFWLGYSLGNDTFHQYTYSLLTGNDQFLLKLGDKDIMISDASPVPLPASIWLLGAALVGLAGFSRRYLR